MTRLFNRPALILMLGAAMFVGCSHVRGFGSGSRSTGGCGSGGCSSGGCSAGTQSPSPQQMAGTQSQNYQQLFDSAPAPPAGALSPFGGSGSR